MTPALSSRRSVAALRVRILLAGALVACAGLSFGPVFGSAVFPGPPMLLVAVLVPVAVAIGWGLVAGVSTGHPGGLASAAGVVAVLGAVAVVTRPGRQVASGPLWLLTGALPLEASGPELAAVSALTGLAALVAVWFALPGATVLAPLLPALACLAGGLGLGAGVGPLPGWYPVLFLVLVAVLLVTSRLREQDRGVPGGLLAGAGLIILVAVLTVPLLGPVLPGAGREAADVRALVEAPVQPRARINPFAQYVALREGIAELEITGTVSEPVERLRMVTLTEFDGRSWSVRADYRRAGHRLPPAEPPAVPVPVRTVQADVTVRSAGTLGWLPTPGRAQQISVSGLGVDEHTGDLVIPDDQATPSRYRVVAAEPMPGLWALRADEPAPAPAPFALTLPPDVLEFSSAATAGEPAGFPRFAALYSTLKGPPFVTDTSTRAPGGHGLFAISALLRDTRGTSEQYASAFALMCRSLGWDARVVLGFRPSYEGTELTVRGADVHAWAEVRFARLGWVTVDPTPDRTVDAARPEAPGPAPGHRAEDPVTAASNAEQQVPPESQAPGARSPSPAGAGESLAGPMLLLGLVGSGLVGLVSAIPLSKLVRRARRRRRGTPRTRTVAAWQEVVDRLVESGLPIARSATTGEVVVAAALVTSQPHALDALGKRADRAAFAPGELPPEAADDAWRASDQLGRALRAQLSVPRRFRAVFDPRPLVSRDSRGGHGHQFLHRSH